MPIDRDELTTSLVRQWITYDGQATLLTGDEQIQIALIAEAGGGYQVSQAVRPNPWAKRLMQDWKIAADELPEIFNQLNRGQSIEVTNSEDRPLRIWVNPME